MNNSWEEKKKKEKPITGGARKTILVDRSSGFSIRVNIYRVPRERGNMEERQGGGTQKKTQGRKNRKVIQISPSHTRSKLGVVMVTFAACQ